MNNRLQGIFAQLIPFIILGITIAFIIGAIIMFAYVVIWGILIGSIFWLVSVIKNYFFTPKPPPSSRKRKGKIIEHDDED